MAIPIQIGLMLQCCLLGSFWKSGSAASRSQNQWVCDWCVYSHSVAHTSFVRKLVNCLRFIWVPRLLNWYWSTEQKWVGVRKSHSTCLPVEFSEQLFFFFFFLSISQLSRTFVACVRFVWNIVDYSVFAGTKYGVSIYLQNYKTLNISSLYCFQISKCQKGLSSYQILFIRI